MIKAEWTNADALDLQPTCNQLATDLISRQAVIDALTHKWDGMVTSVFNVLKELPSAQPERKKGKWIKPTGMMPPECAGVYRCSECDDIAMRDWGNHKQKLSNFCPNCGADLRGEQDE